MTFKMNEFTSSEFDTKKLQHATFKIFQNHATIFFFYVYIFEKDTIIQKTNEVKKEIYGELEGHLSKDGKLFYQCIQAFVI